MWEFVINLLEVAILFLLFNNKLEKKELSYSYPLQILCLFSQAVSVSYTHLTLPTNREV